VRYATTQDPAMADVVEAWRAIWQPLGDRAVEGLAGLFESAPRPVPAARVQATAQRYQQALLDAGRA
jgi:hypothetical protein